MNDEGADAKPPAGKPHNFVDFSNGDETEVMFVPPAGTAGTSAADTAAGPPRALTLPPAPVPAPAVAPVMNAAASDREEKLFSAGALCWGRKRMIFCWGILLGQKKDDFLLGHSAGAEKG